MWLASISASVIGRGMQNLPLQVDHGELLEVSVTGGHELAAASVVANDTVSASAVAKHGAGCGLGSISPISESDDMDDAMRFEPAPVSSTFTSPSNKLVNVNFGQTFSDESNVPPSLIVIDPVEDLKADRPTLTLQFSVVPVL